MSIDEAKSRLKINGDNVEFDTRNINQTQNTPNLPNNSVVEPQNTNNQVNENVQNNESNIANFNNIEYNQNQLKGDVSNVNRASQISGINNVLQNQSNQFDERFNSTNQEQRNFKGNKYIYSPKSYNIERRTVREIFGDNAQTNINNKGIELTENQNHYYSESKIRSENGNLLQVYHGSKQSFDTFDKTKIGSNTGNVGIYGYGFYFTENEALASNYNFEAEMIEDYHPMKVYLNITNPFYWNSIKTEQQMNEFIKEIGLNNEILRWDKYNQELNLITDSEKAKQFSQTLQQNGYDGIIYKYDNGKTTSEIVAFEPNQIKSVDNLNPTNSDNIYDKGLGNSSFSDEKSISNVLVLCHLKWY